MEDVQRGGLPRWKRVLDFAAILLFSPGLLLLGGAAALLIKLGSPGPVLFRQLRVGQKGRVFTIFKFRTMKQDADPGPHRDHMGYLIRSGVPMTKLDAGRDARLIPFGRALRSTGLDELPQVINVLRGEMSLVGPRPCIPYEYDRYQPAQRHRLDAVPGLTGLWQVSGKNRTTFEEMVALDIQYSRQQSLWLDLWIMLRTVPALWRQCQDMRAANSAPPQPATVVRTALNS